MVVLIGTFFANVCLSGFNDTMHRPSQNVACVHSSWSALSPFPPRPPVLLPGAAPDCPPTAYVRMCVFVHVCMRMCVHKRMKNAHNTPEQVSVCFCMIHSKECKALNRCEFTKDVENLVQISQRSHAQQALHDTHDVQDTQIPDPPMQPTPGYILHTTY